MSLLLIKSFQNFGFVVGGAKPGFCGVGVAFGVVTGFGFFEIGKQFWCVRVAEDDQARDDVKAVFGSEGQNHLP